MWFFSNFHSMEILLISEFSARNFIIYKMRMLKISAFQPLYSFLNVRFCRENKFTYARIWGEWNFLCFLSVDFTAKRTKECCA